MTPPATLEAFKSYATQAIRVSVLRAQSDVEHSLAAELEAHIREFQPSPALAARMAPRPAATASNPALTRPTFTRPRPLQPSPLPS